MDCFRSAVFSLCKLISNKAESKDVRNLVYQLNYSHDDIEPPHGELGYISRNQNLQFLGYLLTDDSVDDINNGGNFHVSHLTDDERCVLESAHKTLCFFLDNCLDAFYKRYPYAIYLINPYSNYKNTLYKTDSRAFLNNAEIKKCVDLFVNGELCRKILDNDTFKIFENIDEDEIQLLAATLEREYKESIDEINDDLNEFIMKLNQRSKPDIVEVMSAYSACAYALNRSLRAALQMLYESIIGGNLVVMDNDNIIRLYNSQSNSIYSKYTVLIQDVLLGLEDGGVGSVALLDCIPSDDNHIKEFGIITSLTVSLVSEYGQSSKVTMATVDNDLNPLHNLTDFIMESYIGKMAVKVE